MKHNRRSCRWALIGAIVWGTMVVQIHAAQTFGYTSQKPQLGETQGPCLEQQPGTNLYWHDPLLGNWEHCQMWPAEANGCPPTVYGRVDMLALFRDPKDKFAFASLGPEGPTALSTSDFRSEYAAGVRATIGLSLGTWYRVEALYFGSHDWSDEVVVRNLDANNQGGTGNLYSPFTAFGNNGGVVGLDYNNFVSLRGESELDNGELNIRRRVLMRPGHYETSFIVGGRYMEINEQFEYLSQSTTGGLGASSNFMGVDTRNRMIGCQIGLLSQFLVQPRCWIDFEMKGGIFQNRTDLDRVYTVASAQGGTVSYFGENQRDRTSFVGDLSLQANYQFAPWFTLYGGYNAIWVTGVAIGPENFETDVSVLVQGPTLVDHSGQTVYHGPNVGFVLSW